MLAGEAAVRLQAIVWIEELGDVRFNRTIAKLAKKDRVTQIRQRALAALQELEPDPVAFWTLLIEAEPGEPVDYDWRGWELFAAGRIGEALADFDEGLRYEQASAQPRGTLIARLSYKRGMALARQGDRARAIEAYTKAIEGWPDLACPYGGRGLARLAEGDASGAVKDLETCLKIGLDREKCDYDPEMTEAALRRALEEAKRNPDDF